VIKVNKSLDKLRKSILDKQKGDEKLRKRAYQELKILEEYFGKRNTNRKDILWHIYLHLEADQKELTYSGNRGVLLGVITTMLLYIFNTGILAKMIETDIKVDSWITKAIGMIFISITVVIFFIIMYFLAVGHFFRDEKKVRKQIYINEYLIKLVKAEYDKLD